MQQPFLSQVGTRFRNPFLRFKSSAEPQKEGRRMGVWGKEPGDAGSLPKNAANDNRTKVSFDRCNRTIDLCPYDRLGSGSWDCRSFASRCWNVMPCVRSSWSGVARSSVEGDSGICCPSMVWRVNSPKAVSNTCSDASAGAKTLSDSIRFRIRVVTTAHDRLAMSQLGLGRKAATCGPTAWASDGQGEVGCGESDNEDPAPGSARSASCTSKPIHGET